MKKYYLLILIFCMYSFSIVGKEKEPKHRLFKPNYVTLQPAGISLQNVFDDYYGNSESYLCYSYGFGLERKIAKRFGISYNKVWNKRNGSISQIGDLRCWSIQALMYFFSTERNELSFGTVFVGVNTLVYDKYLDRKVKDFNWNFGFVLSYKYLLNDYFFCKLTTSPLFVRGYMEYAGLHFGFRF